MIYMQFNATPYHSLTDCDLFVIGSFLDLAFLLKTDHTPTN